MASVPALMPVQWIVFTSARYPPGPFESFVHARGGSSRRKSGGRKSALLTLSAALLVLVLAVLAYLVVVSPTDGSAQTVATSGLASWNPHVACSADSVAVQDVLGPAYPSQDLNGSRYQKNSTDGGVPSKRDRKSTRLNS